LENQSDDDTLHKMSKDVAQKGISEPQVAQKMEEFLQIALKQIQAGK